jgi:hypothetical protein
MNSLLAALRNMERKLALEKGEFSLFACFEPVESQGQWDLVISAPWAPRHHGQTLKLLVQELDSHIAPSERLSIARVVIVEPSDHDVQRINQMMTVENEVREITTEEHLGYLVARGFILASHDYWRFLKKVFPPEAEFEFYTKDSDLHVSVSWTLKGVPSRPFKQSRIIVLRIPRESLDDYLYVDSPTRRRAEKQLIAFAKKKLETFNPQHSEPAGRVPPEEWWDVGRSVFQSAVA